MQLLVIFLAAFASSCFASPASTSSVPVDVVCSSISNPDCRCDNSSSSSSPSSGQAAITCSFVSRPPSPLFAADGPPEGASIGTLDLSGNQLRDLPENFFRSGLRVQRLSLSRNNLTRIPAAVWKLQGLAELDLSANQLVSLSVGQGEGEGEGVVGLPDLQELDVSYNLISRCVLCVLCLSCVGVFVFCEASAFVFV